MINKISSDLSVAIGHVSDGDTVLVSGFWQAGAPGACQDSCRVIYAAMGIF